ncbi:PAS domain-containing hybrid sensor histidine kinase/response regulator [Pseudooceanicola aestuarii]|uniref:PAS domain-containing hybrid sensor histidine kinase/response regulator n=1 Tax=Pseudooceanicola aestuarii TaxID=2697319 RepID=UPI0013D198E7|nr:PAS domain-containing hybrid sensor histidine kinase/response regulator [Pseudooceanicola aestuarii]
MSTNSTRVRRRILLSFLLGALGMGALAFLGANVARDLRLLNSASSDNVQWTLSQAEVEFLEFRSFINEVEDTAGLNTLRREYDIFYSRVSTLRQASIYEDLRGVPQFSRNLQIVLSFLDRSVPLIDSPDPALLAALPELAARTDLVRPHVRALSNSGLEFFARDSDARRERISVTLLQMAGGVIFLVLTLLLLALYLSRLNALNIRRRTEAIEAGRRMNTVTGTALDAVIVSDARGHILDFNAAAEQIFGHAARDAIGRDLGDLIIPDHLRADHDAGMRRIRAGEPPRVVGKGRVRLEAMRANGEVFPVEFAVQSAQTAEGEIFIAFLRDISHRIRAEQELVKARDRALAGEKAKTEFLATMSHEIRTPLNGLLGNLSLLQDTPLSAQQERYVGHMITSGKLLMRHVSDVLDITKYDAGKLQLDPVPMRVSRLLQDIVDNQGGAASANDTILTWAWEGSSNDWILADRDRLQHILMNVIGNAVKFTHGGRVEIRAMLHAPGLVGDRSELEVRVSDTGIGMTAELQGRIFDDFTTGDTSYDRQVGGTGLGLGIAQRFARAFGGRIDVDSAPGRGSTFRVRLPVDPAPAQSAIPAETAAPHSAVAETGSATPAPVRPCHILLVEDNEINRVVAREMLGRAGHRVTEAHDGQQAVDVTRDQRFDLILMDISMPVLDGRGATRAIRAGQGPCAGVPIIALTANVLAEEQAAFLTDGMNDILTKPLSREALARMLATHLGPDRVPEEGEEETPETARGVKADTGPAAAGGQPAAQGPGGGDRSETGARPDPASPVAAGDGPTTAEEGASPEAEAEDHPDAPPLVDPRHMTELHETLGAAPLQGLLARFAGETEDLLAYLSPDPDAGNAPDPLSDLVETAARTHRVAGMAATLGAARFRAACLQVEAAARRNQPDALQQGIAALPASWAATHTALSRAIST